MEGLKIVFIDLHAAQEVNTSRLQEIHCALSLSRALQSDHIIVLQRLVIACTY